MLYNEAIKKLASLFPGVYWSLDYKTNHNSCDEITHEVSAYIHGTDNHHFKNVKDAYDWMVKYLTSTDSNLKQEMEYIGD